MKELRTGIATDFDDSTEVKEENILFNEKNIKNFCNICNSW